MLDYFANLGCHIKPFVNPAEFILEATGAGIPKLQIPEDKLDDESTDENKGKEKEEEEESDKKGDTFFVDAYADSSFYQQTIELFEKGLYPKSNTPVSEDEEQHRGKLRRTWKKIKKRLQDRYASTFWVQFSEAIKRQFLAYWRIPEEFLQKVLIPLCMGIICGTLFLQWDNDQTGALQRAGLIFFSLLFSALMAIRKFPPPFFDPLHLAKDCSHL